MTEEEKILTSFETNYVSMSRPCMLRGLRDRAVTTIDGKR